MTKFWWSGEVQADIGEPYREAMKAIDAELNRLLEGVSFGGKVEQWAFLAIIRKEDSRDYGEVIKTSSRGKVLEFRLKISHADFLASTRRQRASLIFRALHRSVLLMEQLGVSSATRRSLASILSQAENTLLSWVV